MIQTGYAGPRRTWAQRAIAAARLDAGAYEEVEADTTATGQAAGIVAISAVAQAIASYQNGMTGMLLSLGAAFIGWFIAAGVTYVVGVTLFKGTATVGELLRTLGFAQTPGALFVVGVVPILGGLASFAIGIWVLVAYVIAIRQALDISTSKAIITAIVAWLLIMIPILLLGVGAALALR